MSKTSFNIIQHNHTISTELGRYFVCESGRSEAIATWAYQLASQNQSPLWLKGKHFETLAPKTADLNMQ